MAGLALTAETGIAAPNVSTDPSIIFPDGSALVLEKSRGPLRATVQTETVHLTEGGWGGISTGAAGLDSIAHSMNRLPAGPFERLMVAVVPQKPWTHTLYATLFRGDKRASPIDATARALEYR